MAEHGLKEGQVVFVQDNINEEEESDDESTWSPLQLASQAGNLTLVSDLLSKGANPNEPPKSWYGKSALQGQQMLFSFLEALSLGPRAHFTTLTLALLSEYASNPFIGAASSAGYLQIVELLLSSGAIVDLPGGNNGGRTALTLAAGSGNLEILDKLIAAGADINRPASRYHGRTALQSAAENGHLTIVKRLLELGADINALPAHNAGRTALQAAATSQNVEIVDLLLEKGAVVNTKLMRYKGLTALQAAAQVGNQALVERLLDAGADVNAEGCYHNGVTAVYAAAEAGHLGIVKLLVEKGADIEMRAGNKKWTPLQIAVFTGHEEEVQFLKEVEMEKGLGGKGIE